MRLLKHAGYNCFEGHGARYSPPSSGELPLGTCLLSCLADGRHKCGGVTVGWPLHKHVGTVACYKRGEVELSKCLTGSDSGGYATFVHAAA